MVAMWDALRIVGRESQDDWVEDVANATVDTVTLSSPAFIQPGASADLLVGAWALMVAREHPNRERVIETFNPTGGQVKWATYPLSTPPANGERFQVWTRFRPTDVEQTLLYVLKFLMFQIRVDTLTGADIGGLRQIALTPTLLPWLKSPNQVIAVTTLSGSVPSAQESFAGGILIGTDATPSLAPVITLSVQSDLTFDPADSIAIYSWADWRSASTSWAATFNQQDLGTGTTSAPEEWWAWEALYRLSRQTQYRDQDLEQRAINELNRLRPMWQPESSYRAFEPRESWGPSGYGGY